MCRLKPTADEYDEKWAGVDGGQIAKTNYLKTVYEYTYWLWVVLALASLVLQATRTVDVGTVHAQVLDYGELAFTIAFDIEIIWRILATLPNWRTFFNYAHNWIDLTLVLATSIIQIPVIHNSAVYPWFTIFQLARFYRVILEVPRMRPLLVSALVFDSCICNSDVTSLPFSVTPMGW